MLFFNQKAINLLIFLLIYCHDFCEHLTGYITQNSNPILNVEIQFSNLLIFFKKISIFYE